MEQEPPRTPQQQIPTRYRYRVVTSPKKRTTSSQSPNNAPGRQLVPRALFQGNASQRTGLINRPNAQGGNPAPRRRLVSRPSTQQGRNPQFQRSPLLSGRINNQRRTQVVSPSSGQPRTPRNQISRPLVARNPPRSLLGRNDAFRIGDRRLAQPRPLLARQNVMRNPSLTSTAQSTQNTGSIQRRQLLQRRDGTSNRSTELLKKVNESRKMPRMSKRLKPMISRPNASIRSRAGIAQNVGRMMMMNRMKKALKSPKSKGRGGRYPLLRNSSKDSLVSRASSGGMDPYDRLLIRSQLFEEYEDEATLNVDPRILDNKWGVKTTNDLNEEEDDFEIEENILYSRENHNRAKGRVKIPLDDMRPVNAFFDERWGEDDFCEEEYKMKKKKEEDEEDSDDEFNDGKEQIEHPELEIYDYEDYVDMAGENDMMIEDDFESLGYENKSEARGNDLNIRYFTIMELRRQESTQALIRLYQKFKAKVQKISVCCCGRCCGGFYTCNPCGLILINVERNFGTGIASYYDLWGNIICMNIGIFLTCLFLLIIPWLMRTDLGLEEKWSPFLHYKFYLGLLGVTSEQIGDTFFMYSGFTPYLNVTETITNDTSSITEETTIPSFGTTLMYLVPFEFRFFYTLTMILFLFLCFLIIVVSIGKRIRIVNKVDKELKFSTGILSLWDHRMMKKSGIVAQRRFVTSTFLEYLQMEKQKEKGMKRQNLGKICCLCHRRIIGWSVTAIVLIGAPIGVFFVSAFNSTLNSSFPFTSTLIIFGMNSTLPAILNSMVTLESYRSEKVATYNRILRTFVIKTSLLISLIVRVLFTSGEDGECVPTEAGVMFWQLVLVDLFQSVFVAYFLGFGKLVLYRGKKKTEFNIPKNVNLLFYRQSIIWVGTLVSPMLPLLGIFSSMMLFLTSYIVMTCTMRFPSKPITNIKGNIFNQTLLFITLLIVLIPTIVFFVQPGFGCGPAYEEPLVYGFEFKKYFSDDGVVEVIETILLYSPYVLVLILLFSFVGTYLIYQRYRMYYNKYKTSEERVRIERVLIAQKRNENEKNFTLEFLEKDKFD